VGNLPPAGQAKVKSFTAKVFTPIEASEPAAPTDLRLSGRSPQCEHQPNEHSTQALMFYDVTFVEVARHRRRARCKTGRQRRKETATALPNRHGLENYVSSLQSLKVISAFPDCFSSNEPAVENFSSVILQTRINPCRTRGSDRCQFLFEPRQNDHCRIDATCTISSGSPLYSTYPESPLAIPRKGPRVALPVASNRGQRRSSQLTAPLNGTLSLSAPC
jgi:hypothetical protein